MKDKITIIGGGIIGLSIGWKLLKKGFQVEIFERGKVCTGASLVAAGMLAPQAEMGFEEIELFRYCRKSLELYPVFCAELSNDSGINIKIEKCGSLMLAFDRDDTERLRRLYDFREKVGLPVQWITGSEAREIEPLLSPRCTNAIWIEDDAQINNRILLEAIKKAFINSGGKLFEHQEVVSVNIKNGKVRSIQVNGENIESGSVIICAGSWSKQIAGIPEELLSPVRPVKGQLINLVMNNECNLSHALRAPDVYLVPKSDGRLIIGASVEEKGFDITPTAGEIFRLLERGWETIPSIYDLQIDSIEVGLRPGSRDHEPILGKTDVEGLYYATGHYRNGILLTPVTAMDMSELIADGNESEEIKHFSISRFYQKVV